MVADASQAFYPLFFDAHGPDEFHVPEGIGDDLAHFSVAFGDPFPKLLGLFSKVAAREVCDREIEQCDQRRPEVDPQQGEKDHNALQQAGNEAGDLCNPEIDVLYGFFPAVGGQLSGVAFFKEGQRLRHDLPEPDQHQPLTEVTADDCHPAFVKGGHSRRKNREQDKPDDPDGNFFKVSLRNVAVDDPLHNEGRNQADQLQKQGDHTGADGIHPEVGQVFDDFFSGLMFTVHKNIPP